MGSCCFTPRKTEVLWWYWLLLFSIVGIPMLLATLYIAKRMPGEEYSRRQVRIASAIFWGSSAFSLIVAVCAGVWMGRYWPHFVSFLLSFIFCMFITTAACKATEKHAAVHKRVSILLLYVGSWFLVCIFPARVWTGGSFGFYGNEGSLATIAMEFAACMIPAHCWYRFSRSPDRRNAWKFVAGLLGGAFLFWAALRYGNLANLYFYDMLRGRVPTDVDIYSKFAIFPEGSK